MTEREVIPPSPRRADRRRTSPTSHVPTYTPPLRLPPKRLLTYSVSVVLDDLETV